MTDDVGGEVGEGVGEGVGEAPAPGPATNGLGIAGFVCSLLGLCSGGFLSPVGLILSLIALKDEPRGFAIAGVVLGALGTCGILGTIVLAIVAPLFLIGIAATIGLVAVVPQLEAYFDMGRINAQVEAYQVRTGALPLGLDDLSIDDAEVLVDPWGNAYVYELAEDGQSYRLSSTGEDGTPGTDDDIEMDSD